MQLYIHVPFCRKKCHYCGFYSEPLDSDTTPLFPLDSNESISTKEIGTNLFTAKKDKKKSDSPFDSLADVLFKRQDATENSSFHALARDNSEDTQKDDGVLSLSALLKPKKTTPKNSSNQKLNSSIAFGKHPAGVMSLADVLKSQKETNLGKNAIKKATGPTLGDALLPKEQAQNLRKNFGLDDLGEETIDDFHNQETLSLSALLGGKKSNKTSGNTKKTSSKNLTNPKQAAITTKSLNNLKSLISGDSSEFTDMATANDNIRSAISGQNITTFDKATRMNPPKAFPPNFLSSSEHNHPLFRNSYYKLWYKCIFAEIKILAQKYADIPVTSIFFGGGTPSLIPLEDLLRLMRALVKNFYVTQNAEITIEVNPESINKESAEAYFRMGFNRVSLGIQSLQDDNLVNIGRVHTANKAIRAFHILRAARFNNISIDLMWGLPEQKNRNWRTDIQEAINMDPEHISCYGLSVDEGSYFAELEEKGELALPEEKEQVLMYKTASTFLESAGYLQYEISNYAKIGYQCRHNMGYWHGENYLGIGPSATSNMNGVRRTHASNIVSWAQDIQRGYLEQEILNTPILENSSKYSSGKSSKNSSKNSSGEEKNSAHFIKENLSHEEKVLECIMLRLRTSKGLSLAEYKELTGRSFMTDHKSIIEVLSKNDLLRIKNANVYLTSNGMLVSTSILEKFFESTKNIFKKIG